MQRTGQPACPEIDGDVCVHALSPVAQCRACVEACPHGALILDDAGLALDSSACDGCGLCAPACPRDAIALERPATIVFDPNGKGAAWIACDRAPGHEDAPLKCVHAIGTRDLDRLARDNIRTLHVLTGTCDQCPRRPSSMDLFAAANAHRRVRASRGETAVTLSREDAGSFAQARANARDNEARIDRGRRSLFAAFLAARQRPEIPAVESYPLAYQAPAIDPARCVACHACVQICPEGALARETAPRLHYAIRPEACSGCGLCVDICDQRAIALVPLAPAEEFAIFLDPYRCEACGAPYDHVAGKPREGKALCRICATTHHRGKLFQVIGTP
jgi:Pyruvate/2-oxoacid:ferredoxin oxidoreductase delta subunit